MFVCVCGNNRVYKMNILFTILFTISILQLFCKMKVFMYSDFCILKKFQSLLTLFFLLQQTLYYNFFSLTLVLVVNGVLIDTVSCLFNKGYTVKDPKKKKI